MRVVLTRREPLDDPDGVNIFIVSLAQALSELGHDVTIVTGLLRSRLEYRRLLSPRLELPIIALNRTPKGLIGSALSWMRAKQVIDRLQPDIIIHNEVVPLPLPGTIVQVVHDLEPRRGLLAPVWRSVRRFSTKRCNYVVATTTELRDQLVRDLGVSQDALTLIPKCIDRRAYSGLDLADRERAIHHAGTLPYKDPGASIRAFAALDDPSVALYVTGELTRPTQEALDALPSRLRRSVKLLGAADGNAVRKLHGRVRVSAFPTRYSTPVGSATVMEAIATGTPIVGSVHISRDLLLDRINGLVVDNEPSVMAAAFKVMLDDDALWSRLSVGQDRLVEQFDAYRVARQYLELGSRAGRGVCWAMKTLKTGRAEQHSRPRPCDVSRCSESTSPIG